MKIIVTDWSDDAYSRTYKRTGKATSEIVAEIEIARFTGFSYDGGRLDIEGHSKTIWVWGHQWSVEVVE